MSDNAKASAFIQEYATVSGRKSDRSSRRAVRELRSGVRRLLGAPRQELEQAFTPEELATALKTAKAGRLVAPDLLKHLPLNTQKDLLFILNASWTTGWCPQARRTATIVPFLKKEKDPQAVSSYRPIALTSTIGKLLERLIVNRLSWWLEAKSLLSPWQAGFRKRKCTTDQCLRLSQFVSDGFQSTNKERTVHMIFHYSKAYDTVWRTGLLQKMLDIGVPLRFMQWTTAWLTNRIARVQLNRVTGRCRTFKEGLQQGSVLSPLLFVLYINDLIRNFSESTMVSAYADDLALTCRGRKKEDVALRMQAEVDKVVSWSQQACLTINAAKCEVAFFSLDNANSNQPDGDVHRIQSAIAELCKKKEVRILWVPRHCNLRGNELPDLEAKLGSEVAQHSVPLDSSTRAALIRREERQSSLTHPRLTASYTTDSEKKKRPSSNKPTEQTSSDSAADTIPTSDTGNT